MNPYYHLCLNECNAMTYPGIKHTTGTPAVLLNQVISCAQNISSTSVSQREEYAHNPHQRGTYPLQLLWRKCGRARKRNRRTNSNSQVTGRVSCIRASGCRKLIRQSAAGIVDVDFAIFSDDARLILL